MPKTRTALGLMSAPGLEGIDVAMLVTDGRRISVFGPTFTYAYTATEQAILRRAVDLAAGLTARDERPGLIADAERMLTDVHAAAVERALAEAGMAAAEIDVVGFHGHTVLHDPARRLTVQIGDAARLARRLGIPVVSDFRAADVAAGGQGAPLSPVYLAALVSRSELPVPVAVLTVDATAHVTIVGPGGESDVVAFDSSPALSLIDQWVGRTPGASLAAVDALTHAGTVDDTALSALLDNPYFDTLPPKSLTPSVASLTALAGLSPADGCATLVAYIAEAVAYGLDLVVDRPASIVLAGPGGRITALTRALAERTEADIVGAESFDWSPDHLEAQAFAFLAVRHLEDMALSFPATTGVPRPCAGGVLTLPAADVAASTGAAIQRADV